MEGRVLMLRQLIGEIQDLLELYGSPPLDPDQRWYVLDLDHRTMVDGFCDYIMEERSGSPEMVEGNLSPVTKKCRRDKSCQRSISASSSTEIMDERIWNHFPEDLIEAVIARLPVATFFRFRSVCRKWNSLLTSASFSQQCAEVPRVHPWFYTISHERVNSGAMYDPSLKKWHHPSIPSVPAKVIVLPVASAGGLVCFLDISHRNFLVCNPLTFSFKELPSRSVKIWSRVAVGMILNGRNANAGYKVMWLDCNGDHQIYDSLKNTWTCPGIIPPSIKLPLSLNFRSQSVSIGSRLYFMCANPDGVVSYDVASGAWKQLVIPSPKHLTDHTLAESGGQVLLVGLLSKNAATCICVWELQKMTLLWKEVDRMPNIWCLEFYGKHVKMTCLGNRGLLMLSLRSRRMNRLVTYDVSRREWQRVPDCILPHEKKRQWIACGTAFDPCPTALA